MTAQIPVDAPINVQAAVRSLNADIKNLQQQITAITSAPTDPDITALKSSVARLAKVPTYQTWEDVFGTFPRYANLFAVFPFIQGNVGSGEQVLAQKQFAPLELVNNAAIRAIFWGRTTSNGNAKTLKVRLIEGAYNIILASFAFTPTEAGRWIVAIRLIKVSNLSMRAVAVISEGPSSTVTSFSSGNITQPAVTEVNPFLLQITGSATADSDITVEGGAIPRIEQSLALFDNTVGSSGSSETALAEKILTNILMNDGDSLRGMYWGRTTNNANAKTLRFHVIEGANDTTIVSVSLTVSESGSWFMGFHIKRSGATTFRSAAQITGGPGNAALSASGVNVTSGTATWANAVTLRLTGQGTTNNDITVEGGIIPAVGNLIASFQATVSSSGSSETTLAEKVMDAAGGQNNFTTDGQTVRGIFWGTTVNNVNAKTLRARIIEGANNTVIISMSMLINEAGKWILGFELIRHDASLLLASAQICSGPANAMTASDSDVTQPPATLANAVTIRVTGQGVSNGDITLEGGTLSFEV